MLSRSGRDGWGMGDGLGGVVFVWVCRCESNVEKISDAIDVRPS